MQSFVQKFCMHRFQNSSVQHSEGDSRSKNTKEERSLLLHADENSVYY